MSLDETRSKKRRTEKQKEASRANGARSRGAHSGQPQNPNAERYGRLAQVLLLPGESRKIFMTLAEEFVQSLNPQTPIQHLLVGKMLAAHWRQNRLWGAGSGNNPQNLADENRLDRQFYRAWDRYFRLNKNNEPPNDPSDSFPDTYSPSGTPPEPEKTQENQATRASEPAETADPGSRAETDVVAVESRFQDGDITSGERYNKIVEIWSRLTEKVSEMICSAIEEDDRTGRSARSTGHCKANPIPGTILQRAATQRFPPQSAPLHSPDILESSSTSMPLKPITANPGGEKKIYLLKPRGFCAGVVRAIDVVKIALNLYGRPVYVRKEIVHNKHVVEELRELGAIFVEELAEVPDGARAIFSAHGVSPEVRRQGKERGLSIIDATCPLVTKVHLEAVKFAREGYTIVLIGHKNHDEVIGTLGEAPSKMILVESVEDVDSLNIEDPTRVAYLTQTTLSLDETTDIMARLQERFPQIRGPKSQDICYATENRQMAVKGVAKFCDLLLVVGSDNSSNSKRLVEVGSNYGVQSFLVNDWSAVDPAWLMGVNNVGVTAGASAPEHLVEQIVEALRKEGYTQLEEVEMVEEDVRFSLPPELASSANLYSISR